MAKPEYDLERLCTAIRSARKSMQFYREERRDIVKQYVGAHWSSQGAENTVPVNLIAQYVQTMTRAVVNNNPRVMLRTDVLEDQPVIAALEDDANESFESMYLGQTLERMAYDAFFSIGIVKVDLLNPAMAAIQGWEGAPAMPYAEIVDLDDFVYDVHARDFKQCGYIGHRYRVLRDSVMKSDLYAKVKKDLNTQDDNPYNLDGDEKISTIGRSTTTYGDEEFQDYVFLWDIFLPRHRVTLTLADDQVTGATGLGPNAKPLRVQPWIGPHCGPYHILKFGTVPANAMPKAPLQDLIDLHLTVNNLVRKLILQAEDQKEIIGVSGAATKDGTAVVDAPDGTVLSMDRPNEIKPLNFRGPNQGNLLFVEAIAKKFDMLAGNLALLSGSAAPSKTLGQDEILNENSSRAVANMQAEMLKATNSIAKSICWFLHHHPTRRVTTPYRNGDIQIPRRIEPEERHAIPYETLKIQVDSYSQVAATPRQRIGNINSVMQQIVMPMMPLLQQQGIVVNISHYLELLAKYMDEPELANILSIAPPPPDSGGSGGEAPGMPVSTTRNYNRRSESNGENEADMELANALSKGGGNDPSWQGPMGG